jgi:hypothetical protein
MGKSLDISGNGLSFHKFMKALIHVPKEDIDKAMAEKKRVRKTKARKLGG